MNWQTVLNNWENGQCLKYPKNITDNFIWRTNHIDKSKTNNYEDEFVIDNTLLSVQDFSSFINHINKETNKYTCVFDNLSGDTKLVIPMPRKSKNFATLKQFCDNASKTHQIQFWKKVKLHFWVWKHVLHDFH